MPSKLSARGFIHESTYNESKEWYTPPKIFEAMKLKFDLDVASPGPQTVPWVPAKKHITFPDSDGLTEVWKGSVFCNPPYGSDTAKWVQRFIKHGNGVMLVFARTDTLWFHNWGCKADLLCFIKSRVQFIRGDGFIGGGCGAASMLLVCGKKNVAAVANSNLGHCR